jgi:hypothetical protein
MFIVFDLVVTWYKDLRLDRWMVAGPKCCNKRLERIECGTSSWTKRLDCVGLCLGLHVLDWAVGLYSWKKKRLTNWVVLSPTAATLLNPPNCRYATQPTSSKHLGVTIEKGGNLYSSKWLSTYSPGGCWGYLAPLLFYSTSMVTKCSVGDRY